MLERFNLFTLSNDETQGVELQEEDIKLRAEEGARSLIGRIFGDKKANFLGLKNAFMKLWQHKGLDKVIALEQNAVQFIFGKASNREAVLQGRPWFFENQILILQPWSDTPNWEEEGFKISPL